MFVIPMVGLSSRFFKAGYTQPKFQLDLAGESVFARSVRSFSSYFDSDDFLFITRSDFNTPDFVKQELERLGVRKYRIVVLPHETRGQAETVYLGLGDTHNDEPLYIFNIDTFRYGFRKPDFAATCDGYLEVFEGEGDHWSFVDPDEHGLVRRTTEKERISSLCSDGLYYFHRRETFDAALQHAYRHNDTVKGEFYIAPLYNHLITNGGTVRYELIGRDEIDFCGTPAEYELLATR